MFYVNRCKDCHTFIGEYAERCIFCHQRYLYRLNKPRGYTLATPEEIMKLTRTYWTGTRGWVSNRT